MLSDARIAEITFMLRGRPERRLSSVSETLSIIRELLAERAEFISIVKGLAEDIEERNIEIDRLASHYPPEIERAFAAIYEEYTAHETYGAVLPGAYKKALTQALSSDMEACVAAYALQRLIAYHRAATEHDKEAEHEHGQP